MSNKRKFKHGISAEPHLELVDGAREPCHIWVHEVDDDGYAIAEHNGAWYRVADLLLGTEQSSEWQAHQVVCRNPGCVQRAHIQAERVDAAV